MVKPCLAVALICLLSVGCAETGTETKSLDGDSPVSTGTDANRNTGENGDTGTGNEGNDSNTDDGTSETGDTTASGGGEVSLGPDNAKIDFIGTHLGDNPDPRHGGFGAFTGTATIADDGAALAEMTLDIETASLWTEIERLTNHLKSPDFFDVREHPSAHFESSSITRIEGRDGWYMVTGDLALHGVEKELSFPAEISVTGSDVSLNAEFVIDRTDFEMNFGPERIVNDVTVIFIIGEPTTGTSG